jgi:hypothetical protein
MLHNLGIAQANAAFASADYCSAYTSLYQAATGLSCLGDPCFKPLHARLEVVLGEIYPLIPAPLREEAINQSPGYGDYLINAGYN